MSVTNPTTENASVDGQLSDREIRALTEVMTTLDDQGAVADAPGLYEVVSSSGNSYAVDLAGDEPHCTCADHLHRGAVCKHIERARYATGQKAIPGWVDEDELDDQLGAHVTEGQPRVAMTDGGAIAQSGSVSRRSAGRDDYTLIGIDSEGAHHVYRTFTEEVLVVEDGAVTYRYDLEALGHDVNDWIDYVADRRGWAEQRLFKTMVDAIGGAL